VTRRLRTGPREKGAIAVEAALTAPILILLVVGAVHFGLVLKTRHSLADAANYAVRAAAVSRNTSAAQVRSYMMGRLGGASADCTSLTVNATVATDAAGLSSLSMTATCRLAPTFGGTLLGPVGPDELTVSAGMPL
jgi:Flp pilus assembly protein TadG